MTFDASEIVSACVMCGGHRLATTSMSDVLRCETCGLMFRSPRPTQAAIKQSYDSGAIYERWAAEEGHREPMWRRRVDLLRRHDAGRRLLDVGTGDGRFLESARLGGFQPEGTELSDAGAAIARQRGFHVATGQFTSMPFSDASFDCVTAWHVLEHVPDPGAFVRRAFATLVPGGLFVVAVPNESRLLLKARLGLEKKHPMGEMAFGGEIHLSHFQPATLKTCLRQSGFEIIDFGVDHIYATMNLKTAVLYQVNRALSRLLWWHLAPAMYAVGRRPR